MAEFRKQLQFITRADADAARTMSRAEAEADRQKWQEEMRQRYLLEQEQRKRGQAQLDQPYYDPSLASAIVQRMGPGFAPTYKPDAKHFVQTPYQDHLWGITRVAEGETPPHSIPVGASGDVQMDMDPKLGQVYNFSPQPHAQTFAHEYRHRAGVHDELDNRIYDAMYSQTPQDWEHAVDLYHDETNAGRAPDQQLTRDQSEAQLLSTLRNPDIRQSYLRREYQAAPEGQKPSPQNYQPDVSGFLAELLGYDLNSEPQFVYGSHPPFEQAVAERDKQRAPPTAPLPADIQSLSDVLTHMRR